MAPLSHADYEKRRHCSTDPTRDATVLVLRWRDNLCSDAWRLCSLLTLRSDAIAPLIRCVTPSYRCWRGGATPLIQVGTNTYRKWYSRVETRSWRRWLFLHIVVGNKRGSVTFRVITSIFESLILKMCYTGSLWIYFDMYLFFLASIYYVLWIACIA